MRLDQAYSPFHVDRRRAQRLAVALPCRIVRGDGAAFPAETVFVSADDAAVCCEAPVLEGEILTLAAAGLGLARGRVARCLDEGFALVFDREGRAERLAALIWLEERMEGARPELRAAPRAPAPPASARLTVIDDPPQVQAVVIADLSIGGARLVTALRPGIGAPVLLGALPGRVVRATADGIAIVFTGP